VKLGSFGGAFFILLAERVGMPKEWWRMVILKAQFPLVTFE
jgi:hypothetical protein